jgi:hypothetical protein
VSTNDSTLRTTSCTRDCEILLTTVGRQRIGKQRVPVHDEDIERLIGLTRAALSAAEDELGPLLVGLTCNSVSLSPLGVRDYARLRGPGKR